MPIESPIRSLLIWIILHGVQNLIWVWLIKWGGVEWLVGAVRGNRWDDHSRDTKIILFCIAIYGNIIFIIGIFDPWLRVGAGILGFPGYGIFYVLICIKIVMMIQAYSENRKQR
jgi:hypothetical protein